MIIMVDLLRALEDVVDLGVAHPLLEQEVARVAERSEQLDRLLRDLRDDAVRPWLSPSTPRGCSSARDPSSTRRAR